MNKTILPFKYQGSIVANPSKSYLQRAVVCAVLAKENTDLLVEMPSDDVAAALRLLPVLGASFQNGIVTPTSSENRQVELILNVGESGLLLRLMSTIGMGFAKRLILHGEGTLLLRSIVSLVDQLRAIGLQVESNNGFLPIIIEGEITNSSLSVNASDSSQFLSGLLISLSQRPFDSVVNVSALSSEPYIDLTMAILNDFGVRIRHEDYKTFYIKGNQMMSLQKINIEGDWSGASNHLVGAAISGEITMKGLSINSNQADKKILKALEVFGAMVEVHEDKITVKQNEKRPFVFDATHCPDLFPPLAILACAAVGTSEIKGLHRLVNKESNRQLSIVKMLNVLGVNYRIVADSIFIEGKGKVHGGTIATYNDHRISMAGAIAACIASSEIIIDNIACVAKSYPNFFNDLEALGLID
ncbi:MAG: 3-phosphoshikimate 1-carboxyvinyltransferase [Flavobacteriia bacterium]|nr:3-phosphoshikimate 1-carboxyvinyltransferase [Flavobacteriia bacterium]